MLVKDGAYTEGRVSYYICLKSLDMTPGQSTRTPQGAEQTLVHAKFTDHSIRVIRTSEPIFTRESRK
jgi:hypothetical protein